MNATTYSTRSNATRAARKQYGIAAKEGLTYSLVEISDGKFTVKDIIAKDLPRLEQVLSEAIAPKAKAMPESKTGRLQDQPKARLVLDMTRGEGATLQAICKRTGWQPHTVRGLISRLGKVRGLRFESTKTEKKQRVYRLRREDE